MIDLIRQPRFHTQMSTGSFIPQASNWQTAAGQNLMMKWRFVFICAWAVLMIAALLVSRCCDRTLFRALLLSGLGCYGIYLMLARMERRHEEAAQRAWCEEVRSIADTVDLAGYGIASLEELARYHDDAGRAAVLDALRELPPGSRSLLDAARSVERDAAWD